MLQVTPINEYSAPSYPTAAAVQDDPSLLIAMPRRWRRRPALCAAMALILSSGLYSCSSEHQLPSPTLLREAIPSAMGDLPSDYPSAPLSDEKKGKTMLRIPLFSYGDGRGAFGCSSVAPPVFLSEDEAAQVIREEALKYGVDFSDSAVIRNASLPVTSLYGNTPDPSRQTSDLNLDGYDKALDIGFEFVSSADVSAWQEKNPEYMSTVQSFDMKQVAVSLSESVANTAVFYDPYCVDFKAFDDYIDNENSHIEDYITEQKQHSLDDLRLQVRGFLEWLAAEGVI